ncbi:MAG: hypothetical protein IKV94_02970 [Clostridia bacterium]|nr:hypothetical protein [Clostridia bacterium]
MEKSGLQQEGLLREREKLSNALERQGARLMTFMLYEEGYQLEFRPIKEGMSRTELYDFYDGIKFEGYIPVTMLYTDDSQISILAPTAYNTMNDFLWNYIETYLPSSEEAMALGLAVGALENIIDCLPEAVKETYDTFITKLIQ